jgi:hypothetical protein
VQLVCRNVSHINIIAVFRPGVEGHGEPCKSDRA